MKIQLLFLYLFLSFSFIISASDLENKHSPEKEKADQRAYAPNTLQKPYENLIDLYLYSYNGEKKPFTLWHSLPYTTIKRYRSTVVNSSFHLSYSDAKKGINAIENPDSYVPSGSSAKIYIRYQPKIGKINARGSVVIHKFSINYKHTDVPLKNQYAILTQCSIDSEGKNNLGTYDLNSALIQLVDTPEDYDISYFVVKDRLDGPEPLTDLMVDGDELTPITFFAHASFDYRSDKFPYHRNGVIVRLQPISGGAPAEVKIYFTTPYVFLRPWDHIKLIEIGEDNSLQKHLYTNAVFDSLTGNEFIDLEEHLPHIIQEGFSTSFHHSKEDAYSKSNAVGDPKRFKPVGNSETIFARMEIADCFYVVGVYTSIVRKPRLKKENIPKIIGCFDEPAPFITNDYTRKYISDSLIIQLYLENPEESTIATTYFNYLPYRPDKHIGFPVFYNQHENNAISGNGNVIAFTPGGVSKYGVSESRIISFIKPQSVYATDEVQYFYIDANGKYITGENEIKKYIQADGTNSRPIDLNEAFVDILRIPFLSAVQIGSIEIVDNGISPVNLPGILYTYSFHLSRQEARQNINPIQNPKEFTISADVERVYVRMKRSSNEPTHYLGGQCVFIAEVDIRVESSENILPEQLIILDVLDSDQDGSGTIDLSQAVNQIVTNPEDYVIYFHDNYWGAYTYHEEVIFENNDFYGHDFPHIKTPEAYEVTQPKDTVYVRMWNEEGFSEVKPIYLNLVSPISITAQLSQTQEQLDYELSRSYTGVLNATRENDNEFLYQEELTDATEGSIDVSQWKTGLYTISIMEQGTAFEVRASIVRKPQLKRDHVNLYVCSDTYFNEPMPGNQRKVSDSLFKKIFLEDFDEPTDLAIYHGSPSGSFYPSRPWQNIVEDKVINFQEESNGYLSFYDIVFTPEGESVYDTPFENLSVAKFNALVSNNTIYVNNVAPILKKYINSTTRIIDLNESLVPVLEFARHSGAVFLNVLPYVDSLFLPFFHAINIFTHSFHLTQEDAEQNTNSVQDPKNFAISSGSQKIYLRLERTSPSLPAENNNYYIDGQCVSIREVNITVESSESKLTADNVILNVLDSDQDGKGIVDLAQAVNQIVTNPEQYITVFHNSYWSTYSYTEELYDGAGDRGYVFDEEDIPHIKTPEAYEVTQPKDTVYVRMWNEEGFSEVKPIYLNLVSPISITAQLSQTQEQLDYELSRSYTGVLNATRESDNEFLYQEELTDATEGSIDVSKWKTGLYTISIMEQGTAFEESFRINACVSSNSINIIDRVNVRVCDNVISKTKNNDNWGNSGFASKNKIRNGYVSFKNKPKTSVMVGFSKKNKDSRPSSIKYGVLTTASGLKYRVNGKHKKTLKKSKYKANSTIKVEKVRNRLNVYLNGKKLHTAKLPKNTGAMIVDGALKHANSRISDLKIVNYGKDIPEQSNSVESDKESAARRFVKVYPNPTKGNLNLVFKKPFTGIVKFVSSEGVNHIRRSLKGKTKVRIDISNLPKGNYIIVFKEKGGKPKSKVIVKQ